MLNFVDSCLSQLLAFFINLYPLSFAYTVTSSGLIAQSAGAVEYTDFTSAEE